MKSPWPQVSLGELIAQRKDPIFLEDNKEYKRATVKLYSKGIFPRDTVPGHQIKTKKQFLVKADDLIVAEIDAKVGGYGIVPKDLDGAIVSSHYFLYVIDQSKLNIKFLEYWLKTPSPLSQVLQFVKGSLNYAAIRPYHFPQLKIPLPPLSEQNRIVARIEHVASGVLEATDIQARLEEEYFRLLLSKIREISAGADCLPLKQVAPIVRRHVEIKKNEMYPELGIRSFGKGTFHKPAVKGSDLGRKRLYEIKPGDLLFSNVFSWEGAIAVAQPLDKDRFGSHRFITCVPDPQKATSNYLCHYFLTQEGITKIRAASPGAAGRNKTLGLKKLEEIKVPLPPIKAQIEFDKLLHHIITLKESHKKRQVDLDKILPSVLDRAFKGEL
jgi:type I restriction enzyme S subunit